MKGGIKPVVKTSAAAPGPTAGRRAGGAAGAGARGGPVKGSKALPASSLPPAREPAITAAHLLSLLGPSGGSELRGMFGAQDDRSQPVHNPRIHEFAPLTQAGNRRGRRGSEPREDIITGAIKQHQAQQQQQQQQQQNSFAPQRDQRDQPQQQQQRGYDPRDRDYPPALHSQQSAPHGSFPHQQDYNSRGGGGGGGIAPGMARHSSAGAIPSASSAVAASAAAARATPISPVAANRARAMGSTIFNPLQQEDDLPSSTITGHFRGRVNSAAPVKLQQQQQQQPHQQQGGESSYLQQSSMMNRNPDAQPRRQQPIPNAYARGDRDRDGYGDNRGGGGGGGNDGWNEHKSNAHANPNFPPNRQGGGGGGRDGGGDRDPYARQSAHQNPYDTRDPSLQTQRDRDRERDRNSYQSRSPSRGPPRGGGYDDYNDHSREPTHRDRDRDNTYRDRDGRGGGGGRDSVSSFHAASAAHSNYPSPPHSPQHLQQQSVPRHSWGGGDVSQFEDGSAGARDANRRKKDEMRAILDAQIAEKAAQNGGAGAGPGPGAKSTKYALRHRERQAELAAEQNRLGLGAGGGRESPQQHSFHNSPHHQQQGGGGYNTNQQQQPQYNQGYDQPQQQQQQPHFNGPPPPALFSPSSNSHSRVRSDLHAGVDPSSEGLGEKARAQLEFRRQLAEQVREKESAKASAKQQKEIEDRNERIRLGLAPDPRRPQVDIPGLSREYGSGNQQPIQTFAPGQQQQQFGSQGWQQGPPHSMPLSPGGGAGGGLSPSKLAENRHRAMSSNVFAGESVTPLERKERERQMQVESIAEQIAEKARIKKELQAKEAEMDARDEARLARDRLELPFRLQGMDPMAAAEKASAILRAQEEARRAQEDERNGVHRHPQQQQGNGNERERAGMVSPGHAKTVLAADRDRERDRARQHQHQQHQQPEFEDDLGAGGGDDDAETESQIAKLTALTSAMNKKVESRRRKAQQFEDSGLLEEAGDSRADLDEYEEVPRRVSGVTVAGRRGGKQGPSNKPAASSKKGAAAAAQPSSKSRARSAARGSSKSTSRTGSPKRDSRSTHSKKPSAADRERDQEAKVIAAANERKARILARARKEAGEDSDGAGEDAESERRSRRSSERAPRANSRKPAASVGAPRRKPRVSSASASVLRRHGVEIDPDDGDDVEVELYEDDGTNIDNSARGAGPYGGGGGGGYPPAHHGHGSHSPVRSRIPAPRVQSGKRRKPLVTTGGQIVPQHEHHYPPAAAAYSHGGSAYHSPMHAQQQHMHHPHQPYTDHFSNQPVGVHGGGGMHGGGGFMSSQVHGGGSRGHSTVTSPSRGGQNHPIYSAYGSSSSSSLLQGQGGRAVNASEYPWFASAAAAGAGLDTSLSGNSAFILLPSSSSTHMPPPAGPASSQASRAPSSLAQHGGALQQQREAEEEGILPDELDKLMQHYGQTVGLDQVFDANILPAAQQPVQVAAKPVQQQQQQQQPLQHKAPTPVPSAVPAASAAASKQASRQPSAAGLRPASVAAGVSNATPRPESRAAAGAVGSAMASPAVSRPSTVSLQVLEVESFPLCSLCEESDAAIQCCTCDVAYCLRCAREYHAPKKLAQHVLMRMQVNGVSGGGGGGISGSHSGEAAAVPVDDENYEDDTDATAAAADATAGAGGAGDEMLSPLSPGGGSLEMGSQEWLAGSLIDQSSGAVGADLMQQQQQQPAEGEAGASRALSPNPAAGGPGMAHSGSRSQLARPQPRVVDPFSGLQ